MKSTGNRRLNPGLRPAARDPIPPSSTLAVRNLQSECRVDARFARQIVRATMALEQPGRPYTLGVLFVSEQRIRIVHEQYLQDAAPTDVITFVYHESPAEPVQAEILACPRIAVLQGRRYGRAWPEELARYVVHGLLHACGYVDDSSLERRRMHRRQEQILAALSRQFDLRNLNAKPKLTL